jgi:aminopeptidase-like protein
MGAHNTADNALYALIERLYPICRSITGDGVRETLQILTENIPIEIHEVPSGTAVFDWTIPNEWNIRDAWIKGPGGDKIIDFRDNNLHILNYSEPVSARLSLEELKPHLHTIPEQPTLIPYKTSFYQRTWGFCMPHQQFESLTPGFLFSTHICHPSLANDNLSGISVLAFLARSLLDKANQYSYRFLFLPGTIGAITWLARNEEATGRIIGGLVASLLGNGDSFTYKRSRRANTEFDYLVQYALQKSDHPYQVKDFTPYGYDERQFCSPGFNLAVGNISRSEFGTFAGYHTSADNLSSVDPVTLDQSLEFFSTFVQVIETAEYFENQHDRGEPQLGKYGLYDSVGGHRSDTNDILAMLWVLNGSDGHQSLQSISAKSGIDLRDLRAAARRLIDVGLISNLRHG